MNFRRDKFSDSEFGFVSFGFINHALNDMPFVTGQKAYGILTDFPVIYRLYGKLSIFCAQYNK